MPIPLFRDQAGQFNVEAAYLDRSYLAGIERGLRNPSVRSLLKIANALRCGWRICLGKGEAIQPVLGETIDATRFSRYSLPWRYRCSLPKKELPFLTPSSPPCGEPTNCLTLKRSRNRISTLWIACIPPTPASFHPVPQ